MLQGQCGSSPACPAGFETHSTDPSASYCAGATCDLVDDAAADDDVAYAHDLATCCEASSCAAFSTTFETTPTGYIISGARYYNTIIVPNFENWIIQGSLGSNALPVRLDARLASGSSEGSSASIVIRHIRLSGQFAGGVDPVGGAFRYTRGGDTGSYRPRLVFEGVVFDHNRAAYYAGAIWIAGVNKVEPCGVDVTMDGCTIFRNFGLLSAGGIVMRYTVGGIEFRNTDFLHNQVNTENGQWAQSHLRGPTTRQHHYSNGCTL